MNEIEMRLTNAPTLDALWAEAERLGDPSIEKSRIQEVYNAEIMFTLGSGSRIYAKGTHRNARIALRAAIEEATKLGAGGKQ